MPGRDLHYSELVEVGQRIRKRDLSSVEATQVQLDRIARLDGQLKSYAHVMASSALQQHVQEAKEQINERFAAYKKLMDDVQKKDKERTDPVLGPRSVLTGCSSAIGNGPVCAR